MRSDLRSLYPSIYRGVLETDILIGVEDSQFNRWFAEMDGARANTFIQLADVRGIAALEKIYEINALPGETLEFRRERLLSRRRMRPPFTMAFLRGWLDDVVGEGNYNLWLSTGEYNYILGQWALGEKPIQELCYVINIEATVSDASWYQEVHVFLNRIKPANMVYNLMPLVVRGMAMSETVVRQNTKWNYRLGGWELGENPFSTAGQEEVMKMAGQPSLREEFLEAHARFTAAEIDHVLLNDSVEIEGFQQKTADGGQTLLRYVVPEQSGLPYIENIKLVARDGRVLSDAAVYIPVSELVTLQHIIKHKEEA